MQQPQHAYILHKRAYRETSFLVDAFSREQGKISFVAKGAQRGKSQWRSLLQPFQALEITAIGKASLKTLQSCEGAALALRLSGDALYCGMYLNEVLNRVLHPELPMEGLFDAYVTALDALNRGDAQQPVLRQFELRLLDEMGYGVSFDVDYQGDPLRPGQHYRLLEEQGFVPVMPMRGSLSGDVLNAIAEGNWDAEALSAAKQLCRAALKPLVGEKPLKSRELFIKRVTT